MRMLCCDMKASFRQQTSLANQADPNSTRLALGANTPERTLSAKAVPRRPHARQPREQAQPQRQADESLYESPMSGVAHATLPWPHGRSGHTDEASPTALPCPSILNDVLPSWHEEEPHNAPKSSSPAGQVMPNDAPPILASRCRFIWPTQPYTFAQHLSDMEAKPNPRARFGATQIHPRFVSIGTY